MTYSLSFRVLMPVSRCLIRKNVQSPLISSPGGHQPLKMWWRMWSMTSATGSSFHFCLTPPPSPPRRLQSAVRGLDTGTKTKPPPSTAAVLASSSLWSEEWPILRCVVLMKSPEPLMANGRFWLARLTFWLHLISWMIWRSWTSQYRLSSHISESCHRAHV